MAKKEEIEVTLAKDHTHKGEKKLPDEKIKVTPGVAKWLYDHGVAIAPASSTSTSSKAAKTGESE